MVREGDAKRFAGCPADLSDRPREQPEMKALARAVELRVIRVPVSQQAIVRAPLPGYVSHGQERRIGIQFLLQVLFGVSVGALVFVARRANATGRSGVAPLRANRDRFNRE